MADVPQQQVFESILEDYPIRLSNFEGPLDLLLHLIKKHEVDIYDIPIAKITQQYLETVDLIQELDLDVAGEFLLMAATLIHIKSKMLLPRPETASLLEGEEEDPRDALVRRQPRWLSPGVRRRVLAWVLVVVLGVGLVVHEALKNRVGRPRPVQVEQMGGAAPFVPVFTLSTHCLPCESLSPR